MLMCSGSVSGGRESQKSRDRNDMSLSSVKLNDLLKENVAFGDRSYESVPEGGEIQRPVAAVVARVIIGRPVRYSFRVHEVRIAGSPAVRVHLPLPSRWRGEAIVERGR